MRALALHEQGWHGQAIAEALGVTGGNLARPFGKAQNEGFHLVQLPAYSPGLNPDEGVWNHLKRVGLKNRCCHGLDEHRWKLKLAIRRLQRRPQVLAACVHQCGYLSRVMQ